MYMVFIILFLWAKFTLNCLHPAHLKHIHELPVVAATTNKVEDTPSLGMCTKQDKTGLTLPLIRASRSRHFAPSLLFLGMLMLSGDIEPNPGPLPCQNGHRDASYFPCGYCDLGVSFKHRAVCCDNCSIWYHNSCIELCTEEYEHLQHSNVSWLCAKCHSHNLSNSLYHAYELETTNYYDPLQDFNSSNMSLPSIDSAFSPVKASSPTTRGSASQLAGSRSFVSPLGTQSTNRPKSTSSVGSKSHENKSTEVPNKQDNWRTLVVNCNGVTNKKAELEHLTQYTDPDLLILTETKLDQTIKTSEFLPPNYRAFRKDRKLGGGGVLVAIKNKYPVEEVDINVDCELIWAKVSLQQQRTLYAGAFYRPPDNRMQPLDELEKGLNQLAQKTKNNKNSITILGGDFNVGNVNWDTSEVAPNTNQKGINERVVNILEDHHLAQIHRAPTRESRLLDLHCTDHPSLVKQSNSIPGISDHDVVLTDSNIRPVYAKKPPREIHLFSKAEWQKMKDETLKFASNYCEEHENRSVEENWSVIKSHISSLISQFVPSKKSSVKSVKRVITPFHS